MRKPIVPRETFMNSPPIHIHFSNKRTAKKMYSIDQNGFTQFVSRETLNTHSDSARMAIAALLPKKTTKSLCNQRK